ncbi:hypothetical protein C8J56DRAFT_897324 [Mycena floridula]|nr:hypothetical protein C8J56DRAFT_897324 [Mycena floridula]
MPPKPKGPRAESDDDEVSTYVTMNRSKDPSTGTVTFKLGELTEISQPRPNQTTPSSAQRHSERLSRKKTQPVHPEANDDDDEEASIAPKRKPRGRKGPPKSKLIIDDEDESLSETGMDVDAPMDVDPAMDVVSAELVENSTPRRKRKVEPDYISVGSDDGDRKSDDEKPEPKGKSTAKASSQTKPSISKTASTKKPRIPRKKSPSQLLLPKRSARPPRAGNQVSNPKSQTMNSLRHKAVQRFILAVFVPYFIQILEAVCISLTLIRRQKSQISSNFRPASAAGHAPDSPSPSKSGSSSKAINALDSAEAAGADQFASENAVARSFTYDPDSYDPVLPEGLIHAEIHGPDVESLPIVPALSQFDRRFISWRNGSEHMALHFQVPDVSTIVNTFSRQPAWNVFLRAIKLDEKDNFANPSRAAPLNHTWVTSHYNAKTTHALHRYTDGVVSTDPVVCISVGLCVSASLEAPVFTSPGGKGKKSIQAMLMPFEAQRLVGFFGVTRGRKSLIVQDLHNGKSKTTALSFETRQSEVRLDANQSVKMGKRSLDANDKVPVFDLRNNFSLSKLNKLASYPVWNTSEPIRGCVLLLGYTAGIYHPDGVADREALNFNILWAGVLHKKSALENLKFPNTKTI